MAMADVQNAGIIIIIIIIIIIRYHIKQVNNGLTTAGASTAAVTESGLYTIGVPTSYAYTFIHISSVDSTT
jgi:hypothetical protein